eukprot:4517581-Amphidinium_carterae.2
MLRHSTSTSCALKTQSIGPIVALAVLMHSWTYKPHHTPPVQASGRTKIFCHSRLLYGKCSHSELKHERFVKHSVTFTKLDGSEGTLELEP